MHKNKVQNDPTVVWMPEFNGNSCKQSIRKRFEYFMVDFLEIDCSLFYQEVLVPFRANLTKLLRLGTN